MLYLHEAQFLGILPFNFQPLILNFIKKFFTSIGTYLHHNSLKTGFTSSIHNNNRGTYRLFFFGLDDTVSSVKRQIVILINIKKVHCSHQEVKYNMRCFIRDSSNTNAGYQTFFDPERGTSSPILQNANPAKKLNCSYSF